MQVIQLIVYGLDLLPPTIKFFLAPLNKTLMTLINLSMPFVHPPLTTGAAPVRVNNLLKSIFNNPKRLKFEKLP